MVASIQRLPLLYKPHDEREFLPAALEIIETPASPAGRAIAGAIIAFFVLALTWSVLGWVDIVATAPGKIVPTGRSKLIQSLDSGIVHAIHAGRIQALNEQYRLREAQGRAGADLAQVARAAANGAVDTLLVEIDSVVDGTIDETTGAIDVAKGASADTYDIIDEIAGLTLRAGGRVLGLRQADLPVATSPVAALYRYPA